MQGFQMILFVSIFLTSTILAEKSFYPSDSDYRTSVQTAVQSLRKLTGDELGVDRLLTEVDRHFETCEYIYLNKGTIPSGGEEPAVCRQNFMRKLILIFLNNVLSSELIKGISLCDSGRYLKNLRSMNNGGKWITNSNTQFDEFSILFYHMQQNVNIFK
ncbi:unnamed protein product [Trichobilharzia szidati]|nr:unnamed protein product [Trichobilharzia szidati]